MALGPGLALTACGDERRRGDGDDGRHPAVELRGQGRRRRPRPSPVVADARRRGPVAGRADLHRASRSDVPVRDRRAVRRRPRRAAQLQRLGRGLRRTSRAPAARCASRPAPSSSTRRHDDDGAGGRADRRRRRDGSTTGRPRGDRCNPTYTSRRATTPLVVARKFDVTLEALTRPTPGASTTGRQRPDVGASIVDPRRRADCDHRDRSVDPQRPIVAIDQRSVRTDDASSAEVGPAARRAGGASRRCPGGGGSARSHWRRQPVYSGPPSDGLVPSAARRRAVQ